ncbi:MAG TPA: twin-arginine translocase TatA/TatE family subunit [Thermoanaerobaculia bacterium]|nr:twin-arginine translocase TatA/TatE family subunit [Thermoanaerobaculia bacterium]
MPHLGPMELLVILFIVILLFGATRLPQIGRGMGEGIRNFKKGLKTGEEEDRAADKQDARP